MLHHLSPLVRRHHDMLVNAALGASLLILPLLLLAGLYLAWPGGAPDWFAIMGLLILIPAYYVTGLVADRVKRRQYLERWFGKPR